MIKVNKSTSLKDIKYINPSPVVQYNLEDKDNFRDKLDQARRINEGSSLIFSC